MCRALYIHGLKASKKSCEVVVIIPILQMITQRLREVK